MERPPPFVSMHVRKCIAPRLRAVEPVTRGPSCTVRMHRSLTFCGFPRRDASCPRSSFENRKPIRSGSSTHLDRRRQSRFTSWLEQHPRRASERMEYLLNPRPALRPTRPKAHAFAAGGRGCPRTFASGSLPWSAVRPCGTRHESVRFLDLPWNSSGHGRTVKASGPLPEAHRVAVRVPAEPSSGSHSGRAS